ncbi:MAG: DoxX family protein [Sphingobacteriales bacterium]|nr:MAG: DoxX family protein [Sphingobacteriales bacterium]
MKYILLTGRILFAFLFLMSAFGHFSAQSIGFAAGMGVPMANILVPFTGIMEFVGAMSIILGYKAKLGAWLLVLFLVPVTFAMHKFWAITDPMMHQMDMVMFMKNISMTGAALMIAYFGSGELSIDNVLAKKQQSKLSLR